MSETARVEGPIRAARIRPARIRAALVGLLALGLALGLVATLPATPGSALPMTEGTWETGIVTGIADGDTLYVDVEWASDPQFIAPANTAARSYCDERVTAEGAMPQPDGDLDRCRIRVIGIQAPEKAGASGGSALEQCRASSATEALAALLPRGTPVQLRSLGARSVEDNYSGGRLARSVYYQDSPGHWVDAGAAMSASGYVMWFPHTANDHEKPEYTHNAEYRRLVDQAASAHRGLWSSGLCGTSAAASVRVWAVSDPIGDDSGNEFVIVRNDGAAPQDIGGWTVRDSSLVTYTFPAGTTIPAGDYVRVFTGSGAPGTPTARDFHMGGPGQVFANWDPAAGYFHGDGAYLYDAQPGYAYGNLRAWFHYPCQDAGCADPLVGRIRFGAINYNPPGTDTAAGEYVEVVNTSASPVSLAGYAFTRRGSQFAFPASTVLAPGGTLRVSMGTGTDTATTVHLGRTSSLLGNSGDLVAIARLDFAPVDCRAWGSYSCAGTPVSGTLDPAGSTGSTNPPVINDPKPTTSSTRPAAPSDVSARPKKRRLVVRWTAPAANGSASVTHYRVRAYKVTKKGTLKQRATCRSKATKTTCRTRKLPRSTTYVLKVQARNRKGYGPAATLEFRLR